MLCFPNAKINLGLNIIERRSDNFHNIATVFYPIPLSDILEIIHSENNLNKVELKITGMQISGDSERNLCVKAYYLLDKEFDLPPITIYLHKLVPMGAGFGGGSSNGAFTLTLLNQLFELGLADDQLVGYAEQLGSDCAFFIHNKPAFGTGKGNVLTDIQVDLSGKYLVLVKPDIFISTAEAYTGVKPVKLKHSIPELLKHPITDWKQLVINDFEESIFLRHPEIKIIKNDLYKRGALYASMTGSGSAVFGIFDDEVKLKTLFQRMFYWGGWLKMKQ